MDENIMDCGDESNTMHDLEDALENGENDAIEFIKVEHNIDEAQEDDEIGDFVNHFTSEANNSLEDDIDNECTVYEMDRSVKVKTDFTLNFISAVRNTPVLWKKDTPGSKHPLILQQAWDTLAQQFEIPAEHLREKWKLLRVQLRKNYILMEQKKAKGLSREVYQPTWFAFNAMRFLKESPNDFVATETVNPEIIKPIVIKESVGAEELSNVSLCAQELDPQDLVLQLINHVKHSPVLWDTTCVNYKNNLTKMSEWSRIAKLMKLSTATVKEKWKMLRAQFRNNIHKMKLQSASKMPVIQPIWFGFEPMLFLLKGKDPNYLNFTQPKPAAKQANQPTPKPIVVQQNLSKRIIRRPESANRQKLLKTSSVSREANRASTSTPSDSAPKVVRIIPYPSSSPSATRAIPPFRSPFSVSEIDPLIVRTFQNLSQITDKIARTETSPYSGLLSHLSSVLSRKRANDFNEIEGVLLNCLHELNKFPNAGKDCEYVTPRSNTNDEEEEKESD